MSARPMIVEAHAGYRALVRGIRAPIWLIPGALVSVLAGAVFVTSRAVSPPIARMALGVTAGLFAAMLIVATATPVGFRRATVLAWLLMTLTMLSVAAALALAVIDSLP